MTLDQLYRQAAQCCLDANVPNDSLPGGAISQWVQANVNYRPGTLAFIVWGIASAMSDIEAQQQGYENQFDRAAKIAFRKSPCRQS